MTPKKIALIGSNKKLCRVIDSFAIHGIEIVSKRYSKDESIAGCSFALLQHLPPLQNALEKIEPLKRANPDLPIIVMADGPSQQDIVEAFRLGVIDFLFLPLQKETLESCLHRFQHEEISRLSKKWWQRWLPWLFRPLPEHRLSYNYGITAPHAIPFRIPEDLHSSEPCLSVQFLGKFTLIVSGKVLSKLPGKKAKSLLAYLLFQYPRSVHRDILIDRFWPNSTSCSARNCLNVTMHTIRRCFEESAISKNFIEYQDECYKIQSDLTVDRDIDRLEFYWKKGRQIEQTQGMEAAVDTYHQAFAFYRGDFLEDILYEEWVERGRDKYKEIWLVILDRLSKHFFSKGKYQICQSLCRQMLEKDTCLEDVHRRLMECYSKLGMRDMSIRQFQKCQEALEEQLNVSPGKLICELYERILAF